MTSSAENDEENPKAVDLPPKPKEPSQEDCCGNGCNPCVFDLYEQECKIWRKQCLAVTHPQGLHEKIGNVAPMSGAYTPFTVSRIQQLTWNSLIFTLQKKCNDQHISIEIGRHLLLRCRDGNEMVTRQYSPIRVTLDYFEVVVKIYADGKMSSLLRHLKHGIDLEWRGPFGEFTYVRNKYRVVLMLAAGTGITPMIRIIERIVDDEDEDTRVRLLYSSKTYDDILLKDKVDAYKAFWNFTVLYVLTQETDRKKNKYGDDLHYERINPQLMTSELAKVDASGTLGLVCGTRSFETDMLKLASESGITKQNCFKF